MELSRITIKNFKSIGFLDFDIKKYGGSYTSFFLGINESGKSNILQAMSFLNVPKDKYDYDVINNQKNEDAKSVDIEFHLEFEEEGTCSGYIKKLIDDGDTMNFKIRKIIKKVSLIKSESCFSESLEYEVHDISDNLYIKKTTSKQNVNGQVRLNDKYQLSENPEDKSFLPLTEPLIKKYFNRSIVDVIKTYEPKVTLWEPSDNFLISDVDLNKYKTNVNGNVPLTHIFVIAGYNDEEKIKHVIDKITNHKERRRLQKKLSDAATNYIRSIWKHNVKFDIEITDSGNCVVLVKDDGDKNQHDFHEMTTRSQGFKQFISLILSLSVETKELDNKNNLILLDEPETHLHPSGIRDLREELLAIGKNNYLFVSTHSPFLVDKRNKERNIIIRKNTSALTEKKLIKDEQDLRDDEVLDIAFGINVYKDLLFPHNILVEGMSDKIILQKAFKQLDLSFGITNGGGSNIVQIASKLNHDDIEVMALVDDDSEGRKYKESIVRIGGKYSSSNVVSLRDLVGDALSGSTIEDFLDKGFVLSKFGCLYAFNFNEQHDLTFDDSPCIGQIKIYLKKKKKNEKKFLDDLKKIISDDFEPNKKSLAEKSPLLKQLAEKINTKLNQ